MNLAKTYEPEHYEADVYALWEKANAFVPTGEGEPYSIIMPPPNANGDLHVGHTLMIALQDVLSRYYRMQGRRVEWLPGEDHAGFETWTVYEKHLEKSGKSRFDYTREELYDQTLEFVNQYRGKMETQFKRLGASCDWDKLTFTLDPNVVAVAYGTFRKMWDEDLIYRGERIVNYCTKHDTSFSDIEVVYKQEKSHLWTIAFPLADSGKSIQIATTRPETIVGDVAVAVNPGDKRYTKLVGKQVKLPLTDRTIPIIADEMVDMTFGTGAVKITPAHDPNDFEVVERHKELPRLNVIGFDGKMNENAPDKYRGMDVMAARKAMLTDLKDAGLLVDTTDHLHSVGHCYKCDTVIQPLLKDQWFVRMSGLAERAIQAIEQGEINFYPKNKAKVLRNYLSQLRDWNISRQIPWGIPIPAFQNVDAPDDWIFSDKVTEGQITKDGKTYKRDPDTFDTWFSSGQWPYITTLFNQHGKLDEFYPISVMETGHDILFPWVSRMIMLGYYVTGQAPFKDVYLHGLLLDEHGQKMSKSKGNVISPTALLDKYGADALRQGLITNRSAGVNQAFSESTVIAGRNFCNKLWNMARLIESKVEQGISTDKAGPITAAEHWIARELNIANTEIKVLIEGYRFSEAYELTYHVIWDKVADWYLEAAKTSDNQQFMAWVLNTCLQIAHPFIPFVTETIWQTLSWTGDGLLITEAWPEPIDTDEGMARTFDEIQLIVSEVRNITRQINSRNVALIYTNDVLFEQNTEVIRHLAGIGYVTQSSEGHNLRLTSTMREAWLDVNLDQLHVYRDKLLEELTKSNAVIKQLRGRLANKGYVDSAPAELVEQSREQLSLTEDRVRRLDDELINVQNSLK